MFRYLAEFIDRSGLNRKKASIKMVYTRNSRIVADVTVVMKQRVWGEEDLGNLERMVKQFRRTLLQTINEHCDSSLYTLKYHVLDHVVEYIQRFGTSSVLHSSPYEHFNVHIDQAYKRNLQRKRTKTIATVSLTERSYKRAVSYGKKENDGTLGRNDE